MPHPVIVADDCIGCGACVEACPTETLDLVDGVATVVEEENCVGCAACEGDCPVGAITEIAE